MTISLHLVAAASVVARPALAQLSLGLNGGAMRYDALPAAGTVTLAPELRYERPGFAMSAGAGYSAGSDRGRVGDASATMWVATSPIGGHFQLDGLLQGAATRPQYDVSS